MNKILHPTDFTIDSDKAFRLACGIARDQLAGVIVLHVVDSEICPQQDHDGEDLHPDSQLYQSAWKRFLRLRATADDIPVIFQVKIGQPVESIVSVAVRESCDLIVVAARYHDSLIYEIHSSVSTCLISQAHCPVLCLSLPMEYQPHRMLEGMLHEQWH